MIRHIITFDAVGNGRTLYTELLDLSSLGPLEITRASEIEFNAATQQWEVRDTKGKTLFANESRAMCLAWEQQRFNR